MCSDSFFNIGAKRFLVEEITWLLDYFLCSDILIKACSILFCSVKQNFPIHYFFTIQTPQQWSPTKKGQKKCTVFMHILLAIYQCSMKNRNYNLFISSVLVLRCHVFKSLFLLLVWTISWIYL